MAFCMRREEDVATGIRRIVLECIELIENVLSDPDMDRDTAVHSARKSFKRLRAVLRLVRGDLGEVIYQRENDSYRDAARLLAGARDSAVMIATLDNLVASAVAIFAPEEVSALRRLLMERYETVRDLAVQGNAVAEVLDCLQQSRERLVGLPLANREFDAYSDGLQRVYRQGRRRGHLAYSSHGSAALFHDWRKRVKYLWYQLEILQPSWPQVLAAWVDQLHTLSSYLGDDHDLAILADFITVDGAAVVTQALQVRLLALVQRRRAELQAAAAPLGARIYFETPSVFVARIAAYWHSWQQDEGAAEGAAFTQIKPESADWQERLLTTGAAAQELGISAAAVRRLIAAERLPARKLGVYWIIDRRDLPIPGE